MASQPSGVRKSAAGGNVVSISSKTPPAKARTFTDQTGGQPPSDGGESWRDSVETRLKELRTDVRHLLIGGGVITLGLAAAGWQTYQSAMDQMREIAVKQQELSGKLDTMDARINGKFETLGVRLESRDGKKVAGGK